jgi:hypothetical protein
VRTFFLPEPPPVAQLPIGADIVNANVAALAVIDVQTAAVR